MCYERRPCLYFLMIYDHMRLTTDCEMVQDFYICCISFFAILEIYDGYLVVFAL